MSYINQNNSEFDSTDKINNLKKSFIFVLKDFKKNYINYNLNPNIDSYKNNLYTSKGQLQDLNVKLFDLTNNIKKGIINYYETNQDKIKSLHESEELYNLSNDELINLNDKNKASKILYDDYRDNYDKQFYYNLEIFIGILIMIGATIKLKTI